MSTAFNEVANKFFARLQGIRLGSDNSDSYPTWLAKIVTLRDSREQPGMARP